MNTVSTVLAVFCVVAGVALITRYPRVAGFGRAFVLVALLACVYGFAVFVHIVPAFA